MRGTGLQPGVEPVTFGFPAGRSLDWTTPVRESYGILKTIFKQNITKIFLKDFIYLFLERGRKGGREGNINVWLPFMHSLLETWPMIQACALDWELNWWPFGSQAGTQSTKPHQPGPKIFFKLTLVLKSSHTNMDCFTLFTQVAM